MLCTFCKCFSKLFLNQYLTTCLSQNFRLLFSEKCLLKLFFSFYTFYMLFGGELPILGYGIPGWSCCWDTGYRVKKSVGYGIPTNIMGYRIPGWLCIWDTGYPVWPFGTRKYSLGYGIPCIKKLVVSPETASGDMCAISVVGDAAELQDLRPIIYQKWHEMATH